MNVIIVALLITIFGAILWKAMGYSFGPAYGKGQKWNSGIQKEILATKPKIEVVIVSGGFYSKRWEEEDFKKWIEMVGKGTDVRVVTGPINEGKCEETNWEGHKTAKYFQKEQKARQHFQKEQKARQYF